MIFDTDNCQICYEKNQFLKYDKVEEEIKPNPNVITILCGDTCRMLI